MSCQSFLSSESVSLYYCIDQLGTEDIPSDQRWEKVPYTSESFSSTPSKDNLGILRNTPGTHSLSLSSVGLSAAFNQEFEVNQFFLNAAASILGSNYSVFPHSSLADASSQSGTSETRLAFLKIIDKEDTQDYLLFRGCIPTAVEVNVASGSLAQVAYSFQPSYIGNLSQEKPNYFDVALTSLPAAVSEYVLIDSGIINPQSSNTLTDLMVTRNGSQYVGVVLDFTFSIARTVSAESYLGHKPYQYG